MKKLFILLLVTALGAPLVRAQQQPPPATPAPVFRSGTRLVVENVSVKDKSGIPVEGLTANDFTITEDGVPQAITFVEYQRLAPVADAQLTLRPTAVSPTEVAPIEVRPVDPTAPAPHIASTPDGTIRYRDRRLVVLYFDSSAMPPNDQMRAYEAAQKFIDSQMDPSLLMAVMAFDGGAVRVKSDFTDNHAQLQEVVLRLIYHDDLDGDGVLDPTGTKANFWRAPIVIIP